jgi:predicted nucleotidyltransferase
MNVPDHMPNAYARRLAQRVAGYLKRRYGATKVALFGSLAIGCYNPDFSDIDVYFEGVREPLVADAMADCKRNFGVTDSSGRTRVHYVCASEVSGSVRGEILRGAEEL